MTARPSREDLEAALRAAGAAHHDYETHFLRGERDEAWPGWYAAYVLGRLGDFASPSLLAGWLRDVPGAEDWYAEAVTFVSVQMDQGA